MNYFVHCISILLTVAAAINGVDAYETIPGHNCIRSMNGMMKSMNDLADNSNLVTITKIGESYLKNNQGRANSNFDIPTNGHDIYAIVVTDSSVSSNNKGKALFTSGVHAREYAPPELLARFLERLVEGFGTDAEVTSILQHTEVHAIIYVNPDGRWVAEKYPELYWRKNLNPNGGCNNDEQYGVDINRNFDFMWSDPDGASSNPCDSDYHGSSAESEPETEALAQYARDLFPQGQRKDDPEGDMNVPFGEDITGIYADIHSSGGYVYYPWGHRDATSPDDEALQALGRKINSFNGYKLWAGGQQDFVYEASGDTSDFVYAVLGVASLGFEIGDDFYQQCNRFENTVVPNNMPALMYTAKIASTPFKEVKGPDVLDLSVEYGSGGNIQVTAIASDSAMVNAIGGNFDDFRTGDQGIASVQVYLDVHPNDYQQGDTSWAMQPARRRLESEDYTLKRARNTIVCGDFSEKKKCKRAGSGEECEWFTQTKKCGEPDFEPTISGSKPTDSKPSVSKPDKPANSKPNGSKPTGSNPIAVSPVASFEVNSVIEFSSGEEDVELTIDTGNLSSGKHTLYVQATDSDGYKGPVASLFVDVSRRRRESSLRGARVP